MKNQKKKGMLKTAEAMIAIVMSLIFLVLVLSRLNAKSIDQDELDILSKLEQLPGFRECLVLEDNTCINRYLNDTIPKRYAYSYNITNSITNQRIDTADEVHVESYFITGNSTQQRYRVIRLFYWRK